MRSTPPDKSIKELKKCVQNFQGMGKTLKNKEIASVLASLHMASLRGLAAVFHNLEHKFRVQERVMDLGLAKCGCVGELGGGVQSGAWCWCVGDE